MAGKGPEALPEASPPVASSSDDNDSDSDSGYGEDEYSSEHKSPNKANNNSSSDDEVDDQIQQPLQKKPDPPIEPQVADCPADSNKRKNENAESPDKGLTTKKAKMGKDEQSGSAPVPDESGKKPLFQRLWSEDDEIAILKGLIEFRDKNDKDPMSDVNAFLDFIKASVHVTDVKKEQIVSKVRRLKDRYRNAKKRTLTNRHELHAFELSKNIWGGSDDGVDENDNGMSVKNPSNKIKSKAIKGDEKIKSDEVVMTMSVTTGIQLAELNKYGDVDENFLNLGLNLVRDAERNALEEEWFNFNTVKIDGLVKRFELYHKTTKVISNALKSNKR